MPTETTTPIVHDLKIWTTFFDLLDSGMKTFEVRRNDRGYKVGDMLRLREWKISTQEYTGRECQRTVAYLLAGGQFGVEQGFVALGFAPQPAPHRNQYDELVHFMKWVGQELRAEWNEQDTALLTKYCRQFNIPMP